MCIILFQWQPNHPTPLIAAANRDEFYQRPTLTAAWRDNIFCGIDERAGGTWIGINRQGHFAAVTNYRDPNAAPAAQSRGDLPMAFLQGNDTPQHYLQTVAAQKHHYGPFNLLVGNCQELWYLSNRGASAQPVAPGIHGLSNALLDTPWPKVERGKRLLQQALATDASPDSLLAILTDRHCPPDNHLPATGVPTDMERLLAPIFIKSPAYGTRCSTLLMLHADGSADISEHIWR